MGLKCAKSKQAWNKMIHCHGNEIDVVAGGNIYFALIYFDIGKSKS
jgi:hypothetical protein